MIKGLFIFLFLLLSSVVHAKNNIKIIEHKQEEKNLPKSAKFIECKNISKEYSIILSDHCKEIKNFFNSITKD